MSARRKPWNTVLVPKRVLVDKERLSGSLKRAFEEIIDDIIQFGDPDQDARGIRVGNSELWLWLTWPLHAKYDAIVQGMVVLHDGEDPNATLLSIEATERSDGEPGEEDPALVLFSIRPDRRGIVAEIATFVNQTGCNIEKVSMATYGKHFWTTILITGGKHIPLPTGEKDVEDLSGLEAQLSHVKQRLGIDVHLTRTSIPRREASRGFKVNLISSPGRARAARILRRHTWILRKLTQILLRHRANVAKGQLDLEADALSLKLVAEPREILTPVLCHELETFAHEEGFDLEIE
jgi:glycine cleavage system regulatory protein